MRPAVWRPRWDSWGAREREALSDPLTKRLTLLHRDETLERDAIAQALIRCRISTPSASKPPWSRSSPSSPRSASANRACSGGPARGRRASAPALRREAAVRDLIGRDLDIYDAVADALAAVEGS